LEIKDSVKPINAYQTEREENLICSSRYEVESICIVYTNQIIWINVGSEKVEIRTRNAGVVRKELAMQLSDEIMKELTHEFNKEKSISPNVKFKTDLLENKGIKVCQK
jgi:hypothetical protein